MIDHDRARELGAAAIDFTLGEDEAAELAAHLRECAECRAYEAGLRADAAHLADIAPSDAPIAVRVALEAAISRPVEWRDRRNSRPLMVLIAATLLLAAAIGTIVVGGLIRDEDDPRVELPPLPASPIESSAAETAEPSLPTPGETVAIPTASAAEPGGAPIGETPTPAPQPAVALEAGRWARLNTALDVRSEPGLGAPVVVHLNRGRLAYVIDGTQVAADGRVWYEVLTSRDERGWLSAATSGRALMYQDGVDATVVYCATVRQRPGATVILGNLAIPVQLFEADELAVADLAHARASAELCATMPIVNGSAVSAETDAGFEICGIPTLDAGAWSLRTPEGAVAAIGLPLFGGSSTGGDDPRARLLLLAGGGSGAANDRTVCIDIAIGTADLDGGLDAVFRADACAEVVSLDDAAIVVRGVAPWPTDEYPFERHPGSHVDPAVAAGSQMGVAITIGDGPQPSVTVVPADVGGCGDVSATP